MLKFFARIFGYFLNFIYSFVNNYGIAIIIFTILLKLVMLPISIKQQKTLKKSAMMQAKVREIEDKYSNDKVRQSQELMDLYKRENMSPFSGCLSSIFQFILIISMFYLVSQPLTYMKNVNPEVVSKYVDEMQSEGERINYREIAVIKKYGSTDSNVYLNMNFLGLDLSDVPSQNLGNWKVFIIPVLYVMTSIVSMRLTSQLNQKNKKNEQNATNIEKKSTENYEETNPIKEENNEKEDKNIDENESKVEEKALIPKEENKESETMDEYMKQMNFMMPFMTVSIALIAPLGLALYWFVSNILMIIERLIVNKFFKEGEEE